MKGLSSLAGRAAGAKLVPAFLITFFCLSRPCAGQTYNGLNYSVSGTDITITRYVGPGTGGATGPGGAVTIPSTIPGINGTVTSIAMYAFADCAGVTSVTIPDSVTTIPGGAFIRCSSLSAINVGAQNPAYASIAGVLFNKSQTTLVEYPGGDSGAYTIPDSVTSIGDFAFGDCSALTYATIPDSVTSIGAYAFEGCSGLTRVIIPFLVTSIGDWAFDGCSGLTYAHFQGDAPASFGNGVFADDAAGFIIYYPANAIDFQYPTWNGYSTVMEQDNFSFTISLDLTNGTVITITGYIGPGGMATIPSTIPGISAMVTSIGDFAFYGCSSLESVTIPDSVTSIGLGAFDGCSGLNAITVGAQNPAFASISGVLFNKSQSTLIACPGGISGGYSIPSSVTSIGACAFDWCSRLTSVAIPDSVTSIGADAFYGCPSLTSVTIPGRVTSIEDFAFDGCSGLTSVTIPDSVTSIGAGAFGYCSGLTAINVGAQNIAFTSISGVLFNKSLNMLMAWPGGKSGSYTIPDGVTYIGDYAFGGCSGLTSVILPASVSDIEDQAFSGCSALAYAQFQGSAPSFFGNGVFENAAAGFRIYFPENAPGFTMPTWKGYSSAPLHGNYAVTVYGGYITITLCIGPDGAVTIPSTIPGVSGTVNFIGDYAFQGCSGLTSVTIPNSVTSIGMGTFQNCSGLESVTIPNSVTSIGADAFYGCSGLESVTIPNSVSSIGAGAFYGCSGLTSVTIPEGVASVGDAAFSGCSGLTSVTIPNSVISIGAAPFNRCSNLGAITVGAQNPAYASIAGVLFNNSQTTLIEWPMGNGGAYTIPGSVTSIGDYAFDGCSGLTSVTIPEGVTSIGKDAFYGCFGLTSVTIPGSVTSIGNYGFAGCYSLTDAHFHGNAPASFGIGVFDYDAAGFTVYYPANATGFISPSWNGYSAVPLASLQVTLTPAGAVSAGARWQVDGGVWQGSGATASGLAAGSHTVAFSTVSGWITPSSQTVTITDNNTTTTSGTYILGGFLFTVNSTAITINGYSGPGGVLAIPSTMPGVNGTVTAIGQSAFQGFSGLTSVIIPSGVTSIGPGAFYGCSGLTSVTIPDGVTSIGEEAFEGCSDLASLTIPDSVTSIGDAAFEGCHSLPGVNIPTHVTSIGMETFEGCAGLMSVTIPNGVISIGEDAFYGCSGLTSVMIPGTVNSIGQEAFRACSGLTSLTIPNGVTYIEVSAFYGCSGLTSVTLPSTVTSIGDDAFQGCSGLTSLTIPNSVNSIGQYAFYGCYGMASVTISTNVTSIGEGTFYGCSSLASVTIPNRVTSIGEEAFEGCSGMASLTIPTNVDSIGLEAFRACYSLTSVTLPNRITSIGESTFENCYSLTSISIPTNVNSIGEYAFYGCSGLTNLTIPSSVTSIGFEAFRACSSLTSVTIPNSVTSIGANAFYECSDLTAAYFQGNPPASFGTGVFDGAAAAFTIYYPANANGFNTPTWNGYHAVPNSSAPVPALFLTMNTQKAMTLTATNLVVGLHYQVQGSPDLSNWGNQGSQFTATSSTWQSTDHWSAGDFNQFFFRLQVVQ